jgi:hypothetical protein
MVALLQPLSPNGMNQGDIYRWMVNVTALLNELRTNSGTVRTSVQTLQDDGILGNPTLAIGSTPTAVASAAFEYIINGNLYNKAAVAAGTAPGNDVVPQALYGAVAFDIGTDGTVDAVEATANATGYASAALAVAALPAVAANHARMGWVTATKSDGTFTFGTTELGAANTTVAYTDAPSIIDNMNAPAAVATSAISLSA